MLVLVAALGVALSACDNKAPSADAAKVAFRGVDITGADYARTLALPDVNGQQRTLADFKGKVTVVFFGYTQCPDVCPTTMADLAQVKKSLGADGDKLQAVFVTIDPERDTAAILKSYMASFDPSFVALRGTVEQTQAAAKEFKIYFAKVPGRVEGTYTMDHTAGAFVLDGSGKVRLFERYGGGSEPLLADIKGLIAAG
ncbi:MAG: SCO family protein [Burkholderiales bacterium]